MAIISNGTTIATGGSLSVSANPPTSTNTIGTYVFASKNSQSGSQTYGDTFSGGDWTVGNASGYAGSGSMSGTWRLMGRTGAGDAPRSFSTLLVRIS